jgi:dephospho-CoA kinase
MLVVGLTGGIASGKSTVDEIFRESGIPVVCADNLAREAVTRGSPALEEIRRRFGDEFLDETGNLNRTAIAQLVFQDAEKRKALESIIHPVVLEKQLSTLEELSRQGHAIAIVDVPLLYENELQDLFDLVLVVYVPAHVQESRLVERDKMTSDEIRDRLDAQMNIEVKKGMADVIVDNTGSVEQTRAQVLRIIKQLESLARTKQMSRADNAGTVRDG